MPDESQKLDSKEYREQVIAQVYTLYPNITTREDAEKQADTLIASDKIYYEERRKKQEERAAYEATHGKQPEPLPDDTEERMRFCYRKICDLNDERKKLKRDLKSNNMDRQVKIQLAKLPIYGLRDKIRHAQNEIKKLNGDWKNNIPIINDLRDEVVRLNSEIISINEKVSELMEQESVEKFESMRMDGDALAQIQKLKTTLEDATKALGWTTAKEIARHLGISTTDYRNLGEK